jgi:hypothetical protein
MAALHIAIFRHFSACASGAAQRAEKSGLFQALDKTWRRRPAKKRATVGTKGNGSCRSVSPRKEETKDNLS